MAITPSLHEYARSGTKARRRWGQHTGGSHVEGPRLRVLMTTEGTYPYVMGGVSSWCQLLLDGLGAFDWTILPIVAGDQRRVSRFPVPPHARVMRPLELWSERAPTRAGVFRSSGAEADWLPAALARGLLSWDSDLSELTRALLWCHAHPYRLRAGFRSRDGWERFLDALRAVLDEHPEGAPTSPELDVFEAARLYQTLYWVARTAATPLPPADVVHVTAAGWSAIPGLLHRHEHGTPVLLTEHGLYVREAYLASVQQDHQASFRFVQTRLARGLARLAYTTADVVSPVTDAHGAWEQSFGVPAERIRVIVNGVDAPAAFEPAPRRRLVVSVGRIDPLKDLSTMLRVAAEVRSRMPDAQFVQYGPVSDGQEAYGEALRALHSRLGLGDVFVFKGPTRDPHGALRAADVVLNTSISEGLPMAVLEAMAQGRPVVATAVGGVADVVRGCGLVAPPGDVSGLATSVALLLEDPDLAARLGERGHARVLRRYRKDVCVQSYGALLQELAAVHAAQPAESVLR